MGEHGADVTYVTSFSRDRTMVHSWRPLLWPRARASPASAVLAVAAAAAPGRSLRWSRVDGGSADDAAAGWLVLLAPLPLVAGPVAAPGPRLPTRSGLGLRPAAVGLPEPAAPGCSGGRVPPRGMAPIGLKPAPAVVGDGESSGESGAGRADGASPLSVSTVTAAPAGGIPPPRGVVSSNRVSRIACKRPPVAPAPAPAAGCC